MRELAYEDKITSLSGAVNLLNLNEGHFNLLYTSQCNGLWIILLLITEYIKVYKPV